MAGRYALIIGNSNYKDKALGRIEAPAVDVRTLEAILKDPESGEFDQVEVLLNQSSVTAQRKIDEFFTGRKVDDLLLFYFSGHGVLDDRGRLYFAFTDTELNRLRVTAIPSTLISEEMDNCRSRRQVLILDSCHSGAFMRGVKGKVTRPVDTAEAFKGSGYGRVILTASDATQYAFEGDEILGKAENSLFTHYLIEGIQSGAADYDRDGYISVSEIFDYICEHVSETPAAQTPLKWAFKERGNIYIAKSLHKAKKTAAASLPDELLNTIESPLAYKQKPSIAETKPARIFISYRRSAKEDQALAKYLHDNLTAIGHNVFIDTSMRVGTEWLREIDEQIKSSDYLIVIISKVSADSEMVQAEIQRAFEYRHEFGHPQTLPIRMCFDGLLPYTISAFISSYQQLNWRTVDDNERIAREILEVIDGKRCQETDLTLKSPKPISYSEDGRPIYFMKEDQTPPLPEFDPRILEELDAPGGALKLNDKFYIERDADERLRRYILRSGETITIRASRQTGKSSLIVRGIHHARASARIVHIDMQSIEQGELESADRFTRYLAVTIVRKLNLECEIFEKIWQEKLGPQDKLTKVIEDYVFPNIDQQIILAIDEADRLLSVPFHSDFFALIRSWHNNRAMDELWNRLNILMVISTEPYLLIADPTQSPFNVGLKIDLTDFNPSQVRDLNGRHGNPVAEENFQLFFDLLGGHPYLTRKALYMLVSEHWTWKKLVQDSNDEQGPFGDHLRRQLWLLREDQTLRQSLNQVIHQNRCDNDMALLRLLRAGLVKGRGESYFCRCGLYEQFFKDKLK